MDIPRKSATRKRLIKRIIYIVVGVLAIGVVSVGLGKLKPAAFAVDWPTIWPDTVKRGEMTREVRGLGTLVPEDEVWMSAITQGRVSKIILRPGAVVKKDTIILELTNPDIEQAALAAKSVYESALASYKNIQVQLESNTLTEKAAVAQAEADYQSSKLQAETDAQLSKAGIVGDLQAKKSAIAAEQAAKKYEIEKKRLAITEDATKAQLAVQQSTIDQNLATFQLAQSRVDALKVRAGVEGVLELVPVDVGASVQPGANLARVADPKKLKATLNIAETQIKDVRLGQPAAIDTRNGIIHGHVTRIDPSSLNGTFAVDCSLESEYPSGARPNLSVDGVIELEHLDNVVFVGRPAFGQENSTVTMFKIDPDEKGATRVKVTFGRSSVNTMEIKEGLNPGDKVVLSDTSAWDTHDRISFNH